jgi:hypothetical protein
MTDIEIPLERDRHGWYRFFEMLPGMLSWLLLFMPLIVSLFNVDVAVFLILAYLLVFFTRAIAVDIRAVAGYRTMKQHLKLDWTGLGADIQAGEVTDLAITRPDWHLRNVQLLHRRIKDIRPDQLIHAVIIATVNESREVLEPTIQSVLGADFDSKRIILVMAYEGRAGEQSETRVQELLKQYGGQFRHAMAVKHPADIPNEVIGKGGNVTCAGRELQKYL